MESSSTAYPSEADALPPLYKSANGPVRASAVVMSSPSRRPSNSTVSPASPRRAGVATPTKGKFAVTAHQIVVVQMVSRSPLGFVDKSRMSDDTYDDHHYYATDGSIGENLQQSPSFSRPSRGNGPIGAADGYNSKATSAIHSKYNGQQPQGKSVAGGGLLPPIAPVSSNSASPPRVTNSQLQWRNALNHRPPTCERNMRDLNAFRENADADRKAQHAILHEETIHRRTVEDAEYEQRDVFVSRHEKMIKYLVRLQLSEQVKKATVDKHNEKIHGLFARAQQEDRRKREEKQAEQIRAKRAQALTDRQTATEKKEEIARHEQAALNNRQQFIDKERRAAKEQRSNARRDLIHKKRQHAKQVHMVSQNLSNARVVQNFELSLKNKLAAKNLRTQGLPIHAFLRLEEDEVATNNNNGHKSKNRNSRSSLYRKEDVSLGSDSDDDDDPYGIRDKRSYNHRSILRHSDTAGGIVGSSDIHDYSDVIMDKQARQLTTTTETLLFSSSRNGGEASSGISGGGGATQTDDPLWMEKLFEEEDAQRAKQRGKDQL